MRTNAFIRWLVWGFIMLGALGMALGLGVMVLLGDEPPRLILVSRQAVAPNSIIAPFGANKLEIRRDRSGRVDLWVTASQSFFIEWSGIAEGIDTWAEVYRQDVEPNTTHLIRLRDMGWVELTSRGFYRMSITGPKPPTIDDQ